MSPSRESGEKQKGNRGLRVAQSWLKRNASADLDHEPIADNRVQLSRMQLAGKMLGGGDEADSRRKNEYLVGLKGGQQRRGQHGEDGQLSCPLKAEPQRLSLLVTLSPTGPIVGRLFPLALSTG